MGRLGGGERKHAPSFVPPIKGGITFNSCSRRRPNLTFVSVCLRGNTVIKNSRNTYAQTNRYKKILIIGSGPIVIGQACEFDYSGTQACKALREEGYKVVLVNSNPATIMTDPEVADKTYIEPITIEMVTKNHCKGNAQRRCFPLWEVRQV